MPVRRWVGAELEALKADYYNLELRTEDVAERHRTSLGQVMRLKKKYGWPGRKPPAKPNTRYEMVARRAYLESRIARDSKELKYLVMRLNEAAPQL